MVTLRVCDTGSGIAPEELPHVFDRFYRGDSSRARSSGGTGLGLAICKAIVDSCGGSIKLESTLGAGTTAEVQLPRAAAMVR
jgi:two-component system sensor histidine kinase BaeS